MTDELYVLKALRSGRRAIFGTGVWTTAWMPPREPVLCQSGYHGCPTVEGVLGFLNDELWVAKLRGVADSDDVKCVAREGRLVRRVKSWDDTSARLFAADCAEHVLPIFEKERPGDRRPREAIEAARRFARGEIGAAARDAAGDAAGDAAWDAARDAAQAAARFAAQVAAGDAAWFAARAAEQRWQADRLIEVCDLSEWAPEIVDQECYSKAASRG